jgi:triacylglycerol lipase
MNMVVSTHSPNPPASVLLIDPKSHPPIMKYTYPAAFDRTRAQELLALVNQAYAQQSQGAAWQHPAGYTILAILSSKEYWKIPGPMTALLQQFPQMLPPVPFGFVAQNNTTEEVSVVIRGTITPLEWFDDFSAQPVPFQPAGAAWGNTTRGFNMIYGDLGPQIATAIAALQPVAPAPWPPIFVTGHSLGAALAHLAAAGIAAQFNAQPVSYTFSGPRAGDPGFASAFVKAGLTTWRMYNTEDVVPTVPPAAVVITTPNMGMQGFSPVGQALIQFVHLSPIGYQHIGYPIAATFHADTVADNHNQDSLFNEINS